MSRIMLKTVNKNFVSVELCKGDGYYYFRTKKPYPYMSRSVYVYRLNELTLQQWIAEGEELVADLAEVVPGEIGRR